MKAQIICVTFEFDADSIKDMPRSKGPYVVLRGTADEIRMFAAHLGEVVNATPVATDAKIAEALADATQDRIDRIGK